MKIIKKLFLFFFLLASVHLLAQGVQHPQYVQRESATQKFYDRYTAWQPGTPLYTDAAANDEEFFISRVRPKVRFTNAATQVNATLDGKRKLLWWVPIGESKWNAIPTYHYNSEVFSMWSYLDHYGNWTSPMIRQPAAFMDVCHKNGVINSLVATVGFAAQISSTEEYHGKTMQAMISGGADKFLKYLKYYGIDGVGYNSEFSFSPTTFGTSLNTFYQNVFSKKDAAGVPNFSMAWYSLTNNSMSYSGANWDSLNDGNKDWFNKNGNAVSNNFFLNYNWNSSLLNTSQTTANSFAGRSSYDVYAGMDMQGRSSADWISLQNYNISIGLWGAHNMNMLFESRGNSGSAPETQQDTYQGQSEVFFTGGTRNPVNTPAVSNILGYGLGFTQFHGISKFLNARSTLQTTDLAKEPFVTYFNLGNGKFFKFHGVTTFPNEWYNIGMQDFMPTWRWWITSGFMGRTAADVPATGITPKFTWEDAWFGGSSLKISGQTASEYLHLFKTKFPLLEGDQITVRYKIQKGTGDVRLACSAEGTESQEVQARVMRITEVAGDAWVEKIIKVGARTGELNLAGKTLAMLALKFEGTSADFSILLGEISIKRTPAPIPVTPVITKSELLATNFKGVDFKVIYKMKDRNPADLAAPIYNDEVNTWYYKIYSQQMNEEPVLCTTTTSWASYVVSAPFNTAGDKRIRFGVAAVSLDGNTDSPIAWTDYVTTGTIAVVEGIEIDKPVIKANETFTVRYKDPNHPAAEKWEILNAQTETSVKVITNATQIATSLPNVGIYDLALTAGGVTTIYRGLIQISGPEVGALPQINELKANGGTATINTTAPADVTYTYVGRAADGTVSRGLRLPEKAFTIPAAQLAMTDQTPFTIAFWFKADRFNHGDDGTQLLNIRSTETGWPDSDWGYIWSTIGTDGKFSMSFRKKTNPLTQATPPFTVPNFDFLPGQWTHMALVSDWQNGRKAYLYVNGKKVGESDLWPAADMYSWLQSNLIMIGGTAFKRAGLDGYIDEFQFYKKALSASEVLTSMNHITNVPAELVGYWDFENEGTSENKIFSTGSNKNIYAVIQEYSKTPTYYPITFGPGAPFIAGSNYHIVTVPEWKLDGAQITTTQVGNGENGSVSVKYLNNGRYSATLTLKNGWGSDTKTFEFVKVGASHIVTYAINPTNIHPNNVKLYFANPGSTTFEPVVSGQTYPDGVTLRMVSKPVSLDGVSQFQKWTINGVENFSPTVEMTLTEAKNIVSYFVPYTGLFSTKKTAYNFKVAPNPFVNEVYVQFVKDGKFTMDVVGMNGQRVHTQQVNAMNGEFVKISLNNIAAGNYLINIRENGKLLQAIKVIKR